LAWFKKDLSVDELNLYTKNTLCEQLDIVFTAIGENTLSATMPVNHRTKQVFGILHGGASVALAETLGSLGSVLMVDPDKYNCVGLEINANHIRSAKDKYVTGTCYPIHLGRKTHIWSIEIKDPQGRLVCISRHTVAILEKNAEQHK
jgi:1,4-dihydroxy-2-naphthoyl-CoA hydrolase